MRSTRVQDMTRAALDLAPTSTPRRGLACCALLLGLLSGASAQELGIDRAQYLPLELRVEEYQLDNGWRFLLLSRRDAPVISFETWVDTGSRHDPQGASGMANLMKNMLFKGSDRIGTRDWPAEREALLEVDEALAALLALEATEDEVSRSDARARLAAAREHASSFLISEEFSSLLEDAGGAATLNAYTGADTTRLVVSLPANQLELWCWLESERFSRPVLREFYSERDAVLEDRASRVDADPGSVLSEELLLMSYSAHPYRRPTVGFSRDIAQLSRAEAYQFFEHGYGARHLTTAIVGDFDMGAITTTLRRYFGTLPAGPQRVTELAAEPVQTAERRLEVQLEAPPSVQIAWHVPPFAHADAPAVNIALRLLAYARSSRLERRLVRDDGSASEITVTPALGGNELRGLAMIGALPITGVATVELEQAIYEEIERLASEGPTPEELDGVKRAASAQHLRSLSDNASLARGLAEHDVKGGDWRGLFRAIDRLQAVDAEDVQRVLRSYFIESRRNVVTLVPPPVPEPESKSSLEVSPK
jgi:predicted Zn-dependent peptidase